MIIVMLHLTNLVELLNNFFFPLFKRNAHYTGLTAEFLNQRDSFKVSLLPWLTDSTAAGGKKQNKTKNQKLKTV